MAVRELFQLCGHGLSSISKSSLSSVRAGPGQDSGGVMLGQGLDSWGKSALNTVNGEGYSLPTNTAEELASALCMCSA